MSAEDDTGESPPPAEAAPSELPLAEEFHRDGPQAEAGPVPAADAEHVEPDEPVAEFVDHAEAVPSVSPVPSVPPVVDVHDLDWDFIGASLAPDALRARMRDTVERLESLLDSENGALMLFDEDRQTTSDRAIGVAELSDEPLWFIGDIHGDLLTLESALALIRRETGREHAGRARIVLLGDLFDDGGHGLETLLRVFELILERPRSVCLIAGNHDESLGYDGARFTATVSPADFSDFLNANLSHEWIGRVGKLAIRLAANAPRALFFPDGLLVAHGGFPLSDLHAALAGGLDWNDPRCLVDFVWTRAHPRARKKIPNRVSRGSQYGYEDFAAFCAVAKSVGRPVTHMVRGHDHVEDRYEVPPAYAGTPVLTTVALSRRLERELFGTYVRVPTVARWSRGSLPQVYRLHIPEQLIRSCYPEETGEGEADEAPEPGET